MYLRKRKREITSRWGGAEGEADFLLSREPDVGLAPGTRDHDLSQRQQLN